MFRNGAVDRGAPPRQLLPTGVLRVATGAQALSEPQLRLMTVVDGSRSLKGGCDVAGDEVWAIDGGEGQWEPAVEAVRAARAALADATKEKDLRRLRALALGDRADGSNGIRLGKTHAVRVEAAREFLDAAVEAQAWDEACAAAEALAAMYAKVTS